MSEFASIGSALLGQLSKLVKSLSDDEIKMLSAGEIKLSLVRPGQRLIDKSPALDRALKFMEGLADQDVRRLEDRQANLALLRKGDTVVSALNPAEIAEQVAAQSTEAQIIQLLSADSRLTAANLKKVAEALGIDVPPSIRAKTALQLYIAEKVAQDRGLVASR